MPESPAGRWIGRTIRWGGSALLAVAVVTAVGLGAGLAFGWWRMVPVQTGSMSPAIPAGSAVLATPESFGAVRPGQVIIYDPPTDGADLLVHRVASVSRSGQRPFVRTWGDANTAPDPWTAELQNPPVWRVRYVFPGVGRAIDVVRSPVVRLVLFAVALAGMSLALVGTVSSLRREARSGNDGSDGGLVEFEEIAGRVAEEGLDAGPDVEGVAHLDVVTA